MKTHPAIGYGNDVAQRPFRHLIPAWCGKYDPRPKDSLPVQLRVVPEHTHRIRQPPFTRQVVFQPLLSFDVWVEDPEQGGTPLLSCRHFLWECELASVQQLPHCRVGVRQLAADEVLSMAHLLVTFECALEVGEEFGDAVLTDVLRFRERFFFLVC